MNHALLTFVLVTFSSVQESEESVMCSTKRER